MKTSKNTILITGGGSGIGFETAKLLSQKGNTVIITGRNEEKLKAAAQQLGNVHYIVADVTKEGDVNALIERIKKDFSDLNVLMNNAGLVYLHKVSESPNAATFAREEMETNYFAVVNLTTKLLPLLNKQPEAAVINVSSIVAFAPGLSLPTYSASKAALHSYTQALRLSLAKDSNVKVFELMPPLVDTEFAKDIPSDTKISPQEVAEDLVRSLETNNYEVRVASTEQLYSNFLSQSDKAVLVLNRLEQN
ncbi:SDR family oxidoreductase [Chryseolinea soli]|uniref:SDR family NAD(P)-dependent oxidoreductase n=1 Tax=Chryseolinea soli TaxID=2321403 RepID=A0A385SHP3_9BACT|nr:SDR family NAD(P)-dependent oxidoreductase [Chryseolinea soli]AYB29976.1 SDR family NAD(P)-dependent oxidoreductase [Chryseolinea soli]